MLESRANRISQDGQRHQAAGLSEISLEQSYLPHAPHPYSTVKHNESEGETMTILNLPTAEISRQLTGS